MVILFAMCAMLGFVVCAVWLIVSFVRWDSKKPPLVGMLVCVVLFFCCALLYKPEGEPVPPKDSTESIQAPTTGASSEKGQDNVPIESILKDAEKEPNDASEPNQNDNNTQSELKGTDLFEDIYVPYAQREKAFVFTGVKTFAENYGSDFEINEPSENTVTSIKIMSGDDYVYFAFNLNEENMDIIMTVSYYCSASNSEVSMSNYSTDGSPAYDTFNTHVIGEQPKTVDGVSAQREFLFGE